MEGVDLFLVPELTLWYRQPRGASSYPQKNLSKNLLTLKDVSSSTLASLTNRSHQLDLRRLRSPCFVFKHLYKMEPGDKC